MKEIDYEALGFKSGLEIHHQIKTVKKLFCRCPCRLNKTKYDSQIVRHMRPTMSELGEYDGTALMEFKTKKRVVYRLAFDSVCTYEIDDTPPFRMNSDALDKCLALSKLLGCTLVDEVHVARKQYLDGSIPTGFQRTAIMGINGKIPYKGRYIEISQTNLEEDSCREVSDIGHTIVFHTDRLSIPLIEVITGADMKNPLEVAEVARLIGRLLRTTGLVRRGLGSVRQDVNVSITGGTRVEIKGVSKIGYIDRLTHNEALRQKSLLEIKDILFERGVNSETVMNGKSADVSSVFSSTSCPFLSSAISNGKRIMAVNLPGFGGFMNMETQESVPFKREFSGRVRVIACLDEPVNIVHTEELPGYGINSAEAEEVKKMVGNLSSDVAVIVWGDIPDTTMAVNEIRLRAIDAIKGVPNETRQPLKDGTTDFERILPGPERMYPDTDTPPMGITEERLQRVYAMVPDFLWEREKKYLEELSIPSYIAMKLAISPYAPVFEKSIKDFKIKPVWCAVVLVQYLVHLKREGFDTDFISGESLYELFSLVSSGAVSKEAVPLILKVIADGKTTVSGAVKILGFSAVSDEEIKSDVCSLVEEKKEFIHERNSHWLNPLMGILMEKYRGVIDGSVLSNMVIDAVRKLNL